MLPGQDVFLPYSSISQSVERQLYEVTSAARQAGYPIKIALIGAKTDLGVIPSVFGQPERYAQFLSTELTGVVTSPVLVVMPDGFGLAVKGAKRSTASLSAIPIGRGTDGLGTAAVAATKRLAAAAGHPLAAEATTGGAPLGATASTIDRALSAMLVLGALAALAIAGAAVLRSRAHARGSGG